MAVKGGTARYVISREKSVCGECFDLARAEYCANKKIYFKKWKIHYISLALAYYCALVVNINVVQCPPEKKKLNLNKAIMFIPGK